MCADLDELPPPPLALPDLRCLTDDDTLAEIAVADALEPPLLAGDMPLLVAKPLEMPEPADSAPEPTAKCVGTELEVELAASEPLP